MFHVKHLGAISKNNSLERIYEMKNFASKILGFLGRVSIFGIL